MKYKNDTQVQALKIYPTGYYVYYRINGKRRSMKLGSLDLPIKVARNLAQKNLGLVATGIDPMDKKNKLTLDEAFTNYVQKLTNKGSNSAKQYTAIYEKDIKKQFGHKHLDEISDSEIQTLHDKVTQRAPIAANKCLEVLKATYRHAKIKDHPIDGIEKNPEAKRKRYLTEEELNGVVKILNSKSQIPELANSVAFIWLLILTGARCGEVAGARWSDLQDNKLTLKNHKTMRYGDDRVIYLSKQAMNIINALPRTSGTIVGINSPRKFWDGIRKQINAPDLRLHDLRHSYASFGIGLDMNLSMVGNLLGHRDIAATQRYAHIHEKVSVENAQKIGDHIQKIIMNG